MASIDERVVAMSFENAKFEAGVAKTMDTLAKLNTALAKVGSEISFAKVEAESHKLTFSGPVTAIEKLKAALANITSGDSFARLEAESHKVTFDGAITAAEKLEAELAFPDAKKAFAELEAADDKVTFADAHGAVDDLAGHFSILAGAASVAMGTIIAQVTMGVSTAVSKSLDAIRDGFADYELKIGATQTIMAGTGEDIQTVSKYLKELDTYADKTIYSLRDMTGNIGKFTNAGVKLPIAVDAMKGISNVAALSGANAGEAARAMYNLGQAIGQGTVRLQDWRSVELANMGTKEFKTELIKSAEAMGILKKQADGTWKNAKGHTVTAENFTSTLQDQWLTADVLTKTLSRYADENTKLGKRAYAAATDVKTFSMMIETLAAAAGTGWTDTFEIIFGNLPEATELWTNLTNSIGGFIGKTADARNEVLKTWKSLGGREDLIEAFKNIFEAIGDVLRPIKDAFRDIFPAKTGEDLARITENFRKFTETLKPSPETVDRLRRIFKGLFAVMDIGKIVIGKVIGLVVNLFDAANGEGAGGFLEFFASIGDWLVKIDEAVRKGGVLAGIFTALGSALEIPVKLVQALADVLKELFTGEETGGGEEFSRTMDTLVDKLGPLGKVIEVVRDAWDGFLDILRKVKGFVEKLFGPIIDKIQDFGTMVADAFDNIDWDTALEAIQTGLIGGIFVKIKEALSGGGGLVKPGILENVNNILKGVTDNLKAMQHALNAATLLGIALAIAALAGALLILSNIPEKDLEKALSAVGVGMAELVGAMALLMKVGGKGGFAAMPMIAASMVGLATAIVIMAGALKILGTMSWEDMAKGLVGMGVALGLIAAATALIGPQILYIAPGLIGVAIGITILGGALKVFGSMSWEEMARGLIGVAAALGIIGLAAAFMPPIALLMGPALIGIGIGLTSLAGAVAVFGNMDMATIAKGLGAIVVSLILLAPVLIPFSIMAPLLLLVGPALAGLAVGLIAMGTAIGIFGNIDMGTLFKGLAGIGASLIVLALGLTLMIAALPGAVALMAAASALAVLVPIIAALGTMKWSTILKGLGAVALILVTLGVAGALAAVPIAALGVALLLLGLGITAIGAGLYLIAKGFQLIGAEGAKGIAAVIAAIGAFIVLFPQMVIDFVKGFLTIVETVVKIAPKIVTALVSIAGTLLDGIISLAPKLAEAIGALITNLLIILEENTPKIVQAGFVMVTALLTGIKNNLPKLMDTVTGIITGFLDGIARNMPKILESGKNLLVKFIEGIASKISGIVEPVGRMIAKFLAAITNALPRIIRSAGSLIVAFLNGIAKQVPRIIRAATNIILKFLEGIEEAIPRLRKKAVHVAEVFLNNVAKGLVGMADAAAKAIIRFMRGLEKAIRENTDDMIDAAKGIGDAIMDGIIKAFEEGGWLVKKALDVVFGLIPGWVKDLLGIDSPSKVFKEIGDNVIEGFVEGIAGGESDIKSTMSDTADTVVKSAASAFSDIPALLDGIVDMEPVITPVLDLSQVEKDAQGLTDLTNVTPITAAASYSQAASISGQQQSLAEDGQAAAGGTTLQFNQYNTSPESLSEIEIYRRTKNQLSQTRGMLGLVT